MAHLRSVLSTRQVPGLLTTALVGRLPTAMATLAVLLLVRGQGGSYTLAGALAATVTAGGAVGQPALARVVDRRGQAAPLMWAAAASTAAFLVLAASGAHHPAVSTVAAAVAGLGTPPLEPCLRALWPGLVDDGPMLQAAFSLDVGLQEIVFVVGPLLATAGVALAGHAGGVLACAVFGVLGTVGFASMRASRTWRPTRVDGVHGTPLRHPALVRVFLVALATGVPVGALAVVAAAYADRHGNSAITGWMLAANAAGALTSGLYGAVRPAASARAGLSGAGLLLALGFLPLALPLPVPLWAVAAVVSGLALPVVLTVVFHRVQAVSPPNLLTEANAWVVTSFGLGAAVAALVAGMATDRLSRAAAVPTVVVANSLFTALICVVVAGTGRRARTTV